MHWNDCVRISQEVLHGVCGLFRTHREMPTNGQAEVSWPVQVIDDCHVGEDASVTRVVHRHTVLEAHDPTCRTTSVCRDAFVAEAATRAVICTDLRDFDPAKVDGATLTAAEESSLGHSLA